MTKRKNFILAISFIIAEVILYVLLFSFVKKERHISFSIVALAFFFSLIYLRKNNFLPQIALLFTMISDVFLVVITPLTNLTQSIAMTSFSVTQLAYMMLMLKDSKNKLQNKINLLVRLGLVVIAESIVLMVLRVDQIDYLTIISMFYYSNLVVNVVFSIINYKNSIFLAIGLPLFLLCDTVIGLNFVFDMFNVTSGVMYDIIHVPFNLAWVFYAPSQVLLSLNANARCLKKARE